MAKITTLKTDIDVTVVCLILVVVAFLSEENVFVLKKLFSILFHTSLRFCYFTWKLKKQKCEKNIFIKLEISLI